MFSPEGCLAPHFFIVLVSCYLISVCKILPSFSVPVLPNVGLWNVKLAPGWAQKGVINISFLEATVATDLEEKGSIVELFLESQSRVPEALNPVPELQTVWGI